MDIYNTFRLSISLIACVFVAFIFLKNIFLKTTCKLNNKFITQTAFFAAISSLLYVLPFLKFSLPFFPSFLEIHFDEVPAFIAGFAYGPLSAFGVILIKTIIKLPFTSTLCVGEVADFIFSLAFVLPACLFYKFDKKFKNAIIGLLISNFIQLLVSSFFTTFVMLNFYIKFMGLSEEIIIKMCSAVNKNVTSLGWTFLLFISLPFNFIKNLFVTVLVVILYKKIHTTIDRFSYK